MEKCPICNYDASVHPKDNDGPLQVSCKKCGNFIISKDAISFYDRNKKDDWPTKLSYWIRNHQNGEISIDIRILRDLPNRIILPNPFEQANNIILWFGANLGDNYGGETEIDPEIIASVIGSKSSEDVDFVIQHLKENNIIHAQSVNGYWSGGLTFKGWAAFDELNKPTSKTKIAFMAMKYNDPVLEDIFHNHIVNAVQQTGFEIDLLKDVLRAGSIDDQLRVQIRRAKFLIAELTHGNFGAYWEAGFADGLGKPVIYLCKKSIFDNPDTKPHFDTNHLTTVTWEKETLIEDMKNLKAIIRNTFPTEAIMDDKG